MSFTSVTTPASAPRASLRERKKLATRLSIRRAALDLIADRGFSHVTVEDIAAAADVAPRTFFNYFPSKEAVLFGGGPGRAEELRARLVHDLPGQPAPQVLRAVLADYARSLAGDLAVLGGDPTRWVRQMQAAHADPQLRAAQAAHMAQIEAGIAAGLAERLGTDPSRDLYPALLASAATGAFRATMSFWAASGGEVSLDELVGAAYEVMVGGFQDDCELRSLAHDGPPGRRPASTDRKEHST
jgi:AcrR family transcriptional regulator